MRSIKNSFWKKAGMLMGSIAVCTGLGACGGSSADTEGQKEFVYVPEYVEIDNEQGNTGNFCVIDDSVYYILGEYNESEDSQNSFLCILKAGDKTPSKELIDVGENSSILSICRDTKEGLLGIVSTIVYEDAASEEAEPEIAEQRIEIVKLGDDGKITSTVDISQSIENLSDFYVQAMAQDKEGNIYLSADQKVFVLDQTGKKRFDFETENWINSMFAAGDGKVYICYYGEQRTELHSIDLAKKGIGEEVANVMVNQFGSYIFSDGADSDLLFSVDDKLYSYDFGAQEPTEVLSWLDCDVNSNTIGTFGVLGDGRIMVVTNDWSEEDNKTEITYLTRKKRTEVPEKIILKYACMYVDYNLQKQIIEFNKTNPEYRIQVDTYLTDYSEGAGAYEDGLAKLNAEIAGGNCPDIVDLSSISVKQYGTKGILEDLYPYFDKDEELNREDYLDNILKAYETDGKLYGVSPKFSIQTVVAKTSVVGERQSITLNELMEMVKQMPEETELYDYASKNMVLMYNTMMNMDEYVNWSTGECKFNQPEFIKALEFANLFEKEINYEEDRPSVPERINNGTLLMVNAGIASIEDYQMYEEMYGKEQITFIGFPTSKENGSFISPAGSMLGMSARSANKEGVWQFLRMQLTKESQEDLEGSYEWGFPIMKSALDKQFEKAMTKEYYEDVNGNKVEQAKSSVGFDNFQMDIYAATEEQVAVVRDLIGSVTSQYQYNEQINQIIDEETTAFFEGQKSAEAVADIVQSRVQIYVNENR